MKKGFYLGSLFHTVQSTMAGTACWQACQSMVEGILCQFISAVNEESGNKIGTKDGTSFKVCPWWPMTNQLDSIFRSFIASQNRMIIWEPSAQTHKPVGHISQLNHNCLLILISHRGLSVQHFPLDWDIPPWRKERLVIFKAWRKLTHPRKILKPTRFISALSYLQCYICNNNGQWEGFFGVAACKLCMELHGWSFGGIFGDAAAFESLTFSKLTPMNSLVP